MQKKMKKLNKLNCHPERSEGSYKRFFAFAQNDVIYQQGRSMVEMLGVLAVMGVLSVGGVAMYTNAMNKYKANELLNEASKRAVVVATRALSGQTSIPLTEFSGHSSVAGGTFADEEAVDVSGNTFAIKIKGVDSAVCTQMKNSIGSNTVVREIPETCGAEVISLVFNKDLSTNTYSDSKSTNTGENEGNEETENCSDNRAICGTKCCEEGKVCGNLNGEYECLTPEGNGCTQNSDCNSGEFCAIEGFADVSEREYQECVSPKSGVCISSWNEVAHSEYNTWWSAENYCLSQGKQLASLSSLGLSADYRCQPGDCIKYPYACFYSGDSQPFNVVESCDDCGFDEENEGECYVPYMCEETGEIISSCDSCDGECFPLVDCWGYDQCRFYQAGYLGVYWLKDNHDSCNVKMLEVVDDNESVSYSERDGNMDYLEPLCE